MVLRVMLTIADLFICSFSYPPVCKPAYLVHLPSQDKLGVCARKGTRHKNGGDGRGGGTN